MPRPHAENLVGHPPFGKLTVISPAPKRGRVTYWRCRCECGTEKEVAAPALKSGHTASCGSRSCKPTKAAGATAKDHPDHDIYTTWNRIIQKCHGNAIQDNHATYQDRGIVVCRGWRDSYISFRDDVGQKPTPEHQIDRSDTNGHYSCGHCEECLANGWPMNVRWVTCRQNDRNRRDNRMVTFQGRTQGLADWGDEVGIPYEVLRTRLNIGYTEEEAITTPYRANDRAFAARVACQRQRERLAKQVSGEAVVRRQIQTAALPLAGPSFDEGQGPTA